MSAATPSSLEISSRRWLIKSEGMRLKSYLWHRDTIVPRIFWASVVQRMNMTWPGGSSRVLRNAFDAASVSMWASSMM